jgi:hypothetical protein
MLRTVAPPFPVYSGPPEDAVGAEDEAVQPLEAAGLHPGLYKVLLTIQQLINFNYDLDKNPLGTGRCFLGPQDR